MANVRPCYFFTHYLVIYSTSNPRTNLKIRQILQSWSFQQNRTLFELEVTPIELERIKEKILDIIDPRFDCVIIYPLNKQCVLGKEVYGKLRYRIQRVF